MKFSGWIIAAFVGPDSCRKELAKIDACSRCGPINLLPLTSAISDVTLLTKFVEVAPAQDIQADSPLLDAGIRGWMLPTAIAAEATPPTPEEVKLLREAFATFYGVERDLDKSEELLSKAIDAWQRQPPDEKAGLYRVRGDCYMAMLKPKLAEKDYSVALDLLRGPGGEQADPSEVPTALLGRARAIRSQGKAATTKEQISQAAKDYQLALRLTSREEWDTDAENEEDGALRNPFAAWEWAASLRSSGDLENAARAHQIAAESFDDVGDKARSIMSKMDAGVDLAAMGKTTQAKDTITDAIKSMKTIEGGDVDLLQRLIAKEGESRIALASILWDSGDKQEAESLLGTACYRLEQLEADAVKRNKKTPDLSGKLSFSIDDQIGAGTSCSRFKNEKFLTETLDWPETLQKKVTKLQALGN